LLFILAAGTGFAGADAENVNDQNSLPVPPTINPPAERIIAIADLHGDMEATRKVFRLSGIIDESDHWIAGDLVVVQTGDQLDRGDDEQEILEFLERLRLEADAAGGVLHILNGNHELMNVRTDLRYVTVGGFADFADALSVGTPDSLLLAHDESHWPRIQAFRPGGPFARILARRNTVVIIGDNLFAHGGVLPWHVEYGIENLNEAIGNWIEGAGPEPEKIHTSESPTWTRIFAFDVTDESCEILTSVLEQLQVKRLIVGHSIMEEGITSFCDGKVWCIDVGMARHYGGKPAALEIIGDRIRVLSE
jgi:hypothetical protein